MAADSSSASGKPPHYSYAHYASRSVAEGFDALRFSGPVGRFLAEAQETLLVDALAPAGGVSIVDVGTGTGRAAIALARRGAAVIGLDASEEMLDVARARAGDAGVDVRWQQADAHHLPLQDRSADAVVCLRVLMHAVDWRQCLAELCRVARRRVVIDFPARWSVAAIESVARRTKQRMGGTTEAYRVLSLGEVEAALRAHGYRVVQVRRQFVLPIAVHKRLGLFAVTRRVEQALAAVGLLRLFGSPVTVVAER